MTLLGGLIIAGIFLVAAGVGLWAKMHPATDNAAPDDSGISEAEWSDAIR